MDHRKVAGNRPHIVTTKAGTGCEFRKVAVVAKAPREKNAAFFLPIVLSLILTNCMALPVEETERSEAFEGNFVLVADPDVPSGYSGLDAVYVKYVGRFDGTTSNVEIFRLYGYGDIISARAGDRCQVVSRLEQWDGYFGDRMIPLPSEPIFIAESVTC